ncbi:MAG TPA: ABC transporter permease subunit [Thermoplasmata archaeon]|nr:ABC transporter permease subunit [Thermoplasmata archaeon]
MRLDQAWTVARHDMGLFRRKRGLLAGLIAFPVGVGVGFPLFVAFVMIPRLHDAAPTVLPVFLDAFSFWFVIGAASLPTTLASYSIVGEKISKSLEPLLSTPTTDGEILLGKTLAALVPTVLAMGAGAVVFQVLIDVSTRGALGYLYYPNGEMAVLLLVAMPLAVLTAIEASVVISSRATDLRSAQQGAGLILLPYIFIYVAAEVVLTLDTTALLYISAGLAAATVVLFYASTRTFRREEILTRWK